MNIPAKLASLGITLPPAPKPVAAYVPAVRTGNLIVVAGQLPFSGGQLLAVGPVPSAVSLDVAKSAARQCAINCLSIISEQLGGDWNQFVRVVRLGVFVASDNTFTQQPQVANGASELIGEIFGPVGQHARAAVGVNVLPLGATVEVEMMVEVK